VFLHQVGSSGHVVYSATSVVQNVDTLFFLAWVGPVGFPYKARRDKFRRTCVFASDGICGSRSSFWGIRAMKHRHTIFRPRVEPVRYRQKAHRDTLHRTFVFASGVICGSHSAFRCVRGVKCRCTIFMLEWARCGFHIKCTGTPYAEHLFLHQVVSACHVVHSGASEA
jgi:hypothetical protein